MNYRITATLQHASLDRRFVLFIACLVLFAPVGLSAQSSGTGSSQQPQPQQQQPQAPEGVETGGYRIHQSIEVGYRVNDVTGNGEMYNTLVNLHSGLRLLDQTLSMESLTHAGSIFDHLWINSFGWGGDPNNALRARVGKNRWFDFRANFRRDQNYSDYNLLANPLNPSSSSPTLPVPFSPHYFATTRRMTDLDLTMLPLSRISLRVGYSHNSMTGPSYSSVHEGTDARLLQDWNTTLNNFRFGLDFKLLPHTVVSYDQFLDYYRGDTALSLAPFAPALLPGGGSVELGLPIDTVNKNPCAIPTGSTGLVDSNGMLTNLACNGFFAYNRQDRVRTSTPTERLSMRSNYWHRVDIAGSFAYSSADMNSTFNELFNGLSSRNFLRQSTLTGPPHAKEVSDVADFSVTVHLTEHLRLVDTFRFWAFRIPQSFNSLETDWTIPGLSSCAPPACSLLVPISSTSVSQATSQDVQSFNQNWKRNEFDVVWDATKYFGGRIGYRYGSKTFVHVNDFTTDDIDNIPIHENTALFGFWLRPKPTIRFNFNGEHTNNDKSLVRIGSRKESRYRIEGNYTPQPWAVLGASINLYQGSNGDSLVDYRGHNRNYGFTASLAPQKHFGFDLAYNYNDFQQNAFICFNDTPPVGVTLPVVSNAGDCTRNVNPNNPYNDSKNPWLTSGYYSNQTHYGMGAFRMQALPRTTIQVGYSITSVGGTTPQFNVLQPLGSLSYNYHLPLADVAVDLGHHLLWKAAWNYAQYGENSFAGPTNSRYFHANNATFSVRWAF